uniref:Kelch domain containing 2 n=1 Tax=Neogobius melanostomus TaxID=47308 RepID=A0A8C6WFE5_9GOBI
MAERMDGVDEGIPAAEGGNDSDREEEEEERDLFAWMDRGMEEDADAAEEEEEEEEEGELEEVEVEDDQPLETEASESFELDTPAERSGHVAVVDHNAMYVWGGYKNAQNHGFFDLYLPRNEIWMYSMETGVWSKHVAGGNLHTSMSGSCGVCVDGALYLFGGHHARGNTNRMYRLPLRGPTLTWEEMRDLKGTPPSAKDKLGCWVYRNKIIYFGGYGYAAHEHRGTFEYDESSSLVWDSPGRGWNNHVHVLDLETQCWSQPITTGNTPSPRAAHACATVGNRGYVFGGRYKNYRLNDLYYLDLDTWEWHEMSVPQQGPVGRSWHSFTPCPRTISSCLEASPPRGTPSATRGCTASVRTNGGRSSTATVRTQGCGTRLVPGLMEKSLCLEDVPITCYLTSVRLTVTNCWCSASSPSLCCGSVWSPSWSTGSAWPAPGTACPNTCCTASNRG